MSVRTCGVAVAVSAAVTGEPRASRISARRMYSGRKSCPQKLTQWASSTTKRRGAKLRQQGAKRRSGEALGGDVEDSFESGADSLQGFALPGGSLRAVQQQGGNAQISELTCLVGHQGDKRRDDDGQSAESDSWKLVAEALAGAGRHDADDVVAGKDVGDDFALVGTKARQAEGVGEDVSRRRAWSWRSVR